MTSDDRAFLASRLVWLFRRNGGNEEQLRPFDELSPGTATYLRRAIDVGDDEVPILASFSDEQRWVVLTTDRLLSRHGDLWSVTVEDIRAITIDGRDMYGPAIKRPGRVLTVETKAGLVHRLELDTRGRVFAFLTVLKTLMDDNRG